MRKVIINEQCSVADRGGHPLEWHTPSPPGSAPTSSGPRQGSRWREIVGSVQILVSELCLAQMIGHEPGQPHTTCKLRICVSRHRLLPSSSRFTSPRIECGARGRTDRRSDARAVGEADPVIPVSWSDRLPDFFSRLSVETLPEVSHFVPLEAATEVGGGDRPRAVGRAGVVKTPLRAENGLLDR